MLREIQADIELLKGRIDKMPLDNTMRSLLNDEILSILDATIDAVRESQKDMRSDIKELESAILDTDFPELLAPDTSAHLIATLQAGLQICAMIEEAEIKLESDIAQKKLVDAMAAFSRNAVLAVQAVTEITDSGEEDAEDEEDEEEPDSDGEDGDDDDNTPVEIPSKK